MEIKKKIQVRRIKDIFGNEYKIWDEMHLDKFNRWNSRITYFSLEDALKSNNNSIYIEDLSYKM